MEKSDNIGHDKTKWQPTAEQYDAYNKREVELAMANLRSFGESVTLHSSFTIAKARALLGPDYVSESKMILPKYAPKTNWQGPPPRENRPVRRDS